MRFFEWLVIEEINKKINKKEKIVSQIRDFCETLLEASNVIGFLEEKVILESISLNQRKINESWKSKLSKINWQNIIEENEEDFEDDGEAVLDDPFAASDDEIEKALKASDEKSKSAEEKAKEKRRRKLKKLKDAMLIIRWDAMKKRADLIEELKNSKEAEQKSKILEKLGYSDSEEAIALAETDNEVPEAAKSLISNPQVVDKARSDLSDILYKTTYVKDPYNKRRTVEKQTGIIKKALDKASGKSSLDSNEIFGTLITKLFEILTRKNKRKKWRDLPEGIGNFTDLESGSDIGTLGGVAAYLTSVVSTIPGEEAQARSRQMNPRRQRKWSNTEAGEGVRNPKTKAALVEADKSSRNADPYIQLISLGSFEKTKSKRSERGTRAEKSQTEKELVLRKAIIRDMIFMKLIKTSPIPNSDEIIKALTEYLAELRKQIISSSYRSVTNISTLAKDDSSSAEDSLEAARQRNYWGSDPEGHDKGGSDNEDPADIAAVRELADIRSIEDYVSKNPNATAQEIISALRNISPALITSTLNRIKSKAKTSGSAVQAGSPTTIYGTFKKALETLLKDPSKRLWGLTFCLAYNLDCSAGFPSTIGSVEKVKNQKLFAERLNQMLGRTDISHGMVRQYLMKAKKWIKENYPDLATQLKV